MKCFISNSEWKTKINSIYSKQLPKAARNYAITDLGMHGLSINIASFVHLLKRVAFNAIVHDLALMHII